MAETVSYIIQIKDRFERNLNKFNKAIKKGSKLAKKLSFDLKKLGKSAKDLGGKLTTRLTLPLAALATASIFAFSKLEKGLTNTLTLLSKTQIDKFGKELEEAQTNAIKMGFSIDDVNAALFDNVSALGISKDTTKVFAEAQILAIAGNAKLGSSISGISKTLNIYGDEIKDVKTVSNAFFTAQKVGITDVQKMADNFPKVAGAAKFAGLGFKQAASALAIFTTIAPNTEMASTSLNAVLKALAKPTKESAKLLKGMGIQTGKAGIKNQGFTNILRKLKTEMDKGNKNLGQAIPEMMALNAIAGLTEKKLKLMDSTVIQMSKDLKNGTGMTEAFHRQMKTMDQQLKLAKGSLTTASKLIGKELAPFVLAAAKGLAAMANKFSNLSPAIKQFIIIFGAVTAIAGPLIAIFGTLAMAAGVLGLSLGWVFIIPVAIAAIIFALVKLQQHFQIFNKVGNFFSKVGKVFSGKGAGFDIEQVNELQNKIHSESQSNQKVDISGNIQIGVAKGAELKKSTFSPPIGQNIAPAL